MKPQLIVQQKITAFVNKYKVFGVTADGGAGDLRALAQQKRLAFKEKVRFYQDEAKSQEIFGFRAEKVLDVHGQYFVEDTSGQRIGSFKKLFKRSLISSTWRIMDAEGTELFEVRESNATLAVLRRYGGMLPFVGDVVDIVVTFLKYHFVFVDLGTNEIVGKYRKTTLFRDHYVLEMSDESFARCDWRAFASIGVALDALQSR